MADVTTTTDDRRELCLRLLAADLEGSAATTFDSGTGTARLVRYGDEAYVVKLPPASPLAFFGGRLSAWKHRVIDGDFGCPPATGRERIERFHDAVRVWTAAGFGPNTPELMSDPEDDFIIYRHVEGPLLREAMGSDWGQWTADMRPVVLVLRHLRERHRVAVGCGDAAHGRALVHQDPHLRNVVISGDTPVFLDLDDPLPPDVAVRRLVGRELALYAFRVLRYMPAEQIDRALAQMAECYGDPETWRVAGEYLGRRRRIQLLGFRRRRRYAVSRVELAGMICARLT